MSKADPRVFIAREESDLNAVYDYAEQELQHGELEIEVKPYVPKRSTLANRFYWEILSQAGEQTGHTKDELHIFFRHKFLGAEHKLIFDQNFNMLPSTADLNVKDFANYVRSVETFILESGFTIAAPPYYSDIWR